MKILYKYKKKIPRLRPRYLNHMEKGLGSKLSRCNRFSQSKHTAILTRKLGRMELETDTILRSIIFNFFW